ncbi:MAG TPA: CdaR family protein [Candidatus Limnocylindrales bacterium]|nr:CdaR family protein [Candidatus Limnocylindrales bacterium]
MAGIRRALRFLVRNWPLKLGALLLAVFLYAGLVVSQNARLLPVRVPIEPLRQPAGAFLLEALPDVTSIRFYAPADVAARISSDDFRAVVDLAGVSPAAGGMPATVPVSVTPLDDRVRVIDFEPRAVTVRLDPIVSRTVPVRVEEGAIPAGLTVAEPVLSVDEVRVRGASSIVERVSAVVATVTIDPSAINVDREADLVAVDERGEPVGSVDMEPDRVRVRIQVSSQALTRTVPVSVALQGAVAEGYELRGVVVTPAVVTVSGSQEALAGLTTIQAGPLPVTGRAATFETAVDLRPPAGLLVLGPSRVTVSVTIAARTGSRTFEVGIGVTGARSSLAYSLSTPSVLVTLGGLLPRLYAVDGRTLTATVDVSGLGPGRHQVPVRVRSAAETTIETIAPARITVTVSQPATATPAPASPAP